MFGTPYISWYYRIILFFHNTNDFSCSTLPIVGVVTRVHCLINSDLIWFVQDMKIQVFTGVIIWLLPARDIGCYCIWMPKVCKYPSAPLISGAHFFSYCWITSSQLCQICRLAVFFSPYGFFCHAHSCQFPNHNTPLKPGTLISEPGSCFGLAGKESQGRAMWEREIFGWFSYWLNEQLAYLFRALPLNLPPECTLP